MQVSTVGKMIGSWWDKISSKFPSEILDTSQIMPDHFHGIIQIMDDVGRIHVSAWIARTLVSV